MNRRTWMKMSGLALLVSLLWFRLGADRCCAEIEVRTNLLFIYTDEQAFNTLACYGNEWIAMPNLNALAAQSVVFDRAYVTQPVCTPSRSTLMTGQWPHTNGCVANNIALRNQSKCLPEILPAGQYVTGHFGKWHLGDEIFRQHAFDEWTSYEDTYCKYFGANRERGTRSEYHHYLIEQGYKPNSRHGTMFSRDFCARLPEQHGKPAWIAGRAVDFLERHTESPFALYVSFLEPHMPFFGPRDDQYDPNTFPLPANLDALPDDTFPEKYFEKSHAKVPQAYGSKSRSEEAWRKLRARYYGLCSLVDTHAGRVLDVLKEKGLWENTLIVFTSDHGEMMGAHGQTAKSVMYEEAVRVPLLIKMPGQKTMKRVEGAMSNLDVLPTVVDLMGYEVPDFMQGRSLKAAIQSDQPRLSEDIFIEWTSGVDERVVVTSDGWKFVWNANGKHLLFNLNKDPGETRNLYGVKEHQQRVADCLGKIQAWQKKSNDKLALTWNGIM